MIEGKQKEIRATEFSHALRDSISKWITENSSRQALITVQHVQLTETNKSATVVISIIPTTEKEKAERFLTRNAGLIGKYLRKQFPRRMVPFLKFVAI